MRGGATARHIDPDQHPQVALHARTDEGQEHRPGAHVAATGRYEELNIFGTPTGRVEHVRQGERLPRGPLGFTWRPVKEEGC
jgi:hypothetical protein